MYSYDKTSEEREKSTKRLKLLLYIGVPVALILIIFLIVWASIGGYIMKQVGDTELGIVLVRNNPVAVVPSGVYTDLGFYRDLKKVNVQSLDFCAIDPEVVTNDDYRLSVTVCGVVRRPLDPEVYLENWSTYKSYYTNDVGLAGKFHFQSDSNGDQILVVDQAGIMQNLTQQAMKTCVGESAFREAVIGSGRDVLGRCIDEQVSSYAEGYGFLIVSNVTVPNVVPSESVRASLDAISSSKLAQSLAQQEALTVEAQKAKELAAIQGDIRTQEGQKQEQARQDAITAQLQAQALLAQQDVIRQKKENDLLDADLQIAIQEKLAEAATIKAQANNADNLFMAKLLGENPSYAYLMFLKEIAPAWGSMDKAIVGEGTNPLTLIAPYGLPSEFLLEPNSYIE